MLDEVKIAWLNEIGAKEFPQPVKYAYTFKGYTGSFNLSEQYIEETPLKELKAQYNRNKEYVKLCLDGE